MNGQSSWTDTVYNQSPYPAYNTKWSSSWGLLSLSHRRLANAQARLRICAVSPEPSLFAHIKYGSRRRVRPKIRHLAPTGWLRMRVWRMRLRRTKSTIISWDGSNRKEAETSRTNRAKYVFKFLQRFASVSLLNNIWHSTQNVILRRYNILRGDTPHVESEVNSSFASNANNDLSRENY